MIKRETYLKTILNQEFDTQKLEELMSQGIIYYTELKELLDNGFLLDTSYQYILCSVCKEDVLIIDNGILMKKKAYTLINDLEYNIFVCSDCLPYYNKNIKNPSIIRQNLSMKKQIINTYPNKKFLELFGQRDLAIEIPFNSQKIKDSYSIYCDECSLCLGTISLPLESHSDKYVFGKGFRIVDEKILCVYCYSK